MFGRGFEINYENWAKQANIEKRLPAIAEEFLNPFCSIDFRCVDVALAVHAHLMQIVRNQRADQRDFWRSLAEVDEREFSDALRAWCWRQCSRALPGAQQRREREAG